MPLSHLKEDEKERKRSTKQCSVLNLSWVFALFTYAMFHGKCGPFFSGLLHFFSSLPSFFFLLFLVLDLGCSLFPKSPFGSRWKVVKGGGGEGSWQGEKKGRGFMYTVYTYIHSSRHGSIPNRGFSAKYVFIVLGMMVKDKVVYGTSAP